MDLKFIIGSVAMIEGISIFATHVLTDDRNCLPPQIFES